MSAMLGELSVALDTLRTQMVRAIREGDWTLYVSLANRYAKLNARWDAERKRLLAEKFRA